VPLAGDGGDVRVEYTVYANALTNRTRHADDTHAFISPSCVLMYAPARRSEPVTVRLEGGDPAWTVATGLSAVGADQRELAAANYDVLVDSPIEIGVLDTMRFEVDGVPHEIAIWWGPSPGGREQASPGRMFSVERLQHDFSAIVRAQRAIFGATPYERYVFLLHVAPGLGGGTEHLNSTIMQVSPEAFHEPDSYRNLLSLTSHEMFHTWNVKQLRPAGLQPYDYQRENYTDLLWVSEGLTCYYESVCQVRAGVMTADDFLKEMSREIRGERRRPGGRVQSLAESSFDAWVKFNRPTPDSANTTVSFYDLGKYAGLGLDASIREASGHTATLDDLMRRLYTEFPLGGKGFTEADVRRVASSLAGRDLSEFFKAHVRGTQPLDFAAILNVFGLRMETPPADAPKPGDPEPRETVPWLGIAITKGSEPPTVASVSSDGPGAAAGLIAGDVIVAVGGKRARGSEWDKQVSRLSIGGAVRLLVFRADVAREFEIIPGALPARDERIVRIEQPTAAQRAAYESWLGQPWPGEAAGTEPAIGQ